jgi:histidyl-tRNA synthetase
LSAQDYYSHTVFEFVERVKGDESTDSSPKGGIAVLAGGCYDGLSELLGGSAVSCIGWAAGVDRLALLREGMAKETPATLAVRTTSKHLLTCIEA